ncbi:hypothetical protein IY40_00020 [Serratia marcescens]|nr:hypothetical protein IY40_00020 [Serratia marcescens]
MRLTNEATATLQTDFQSSEGVFFVKNCLQALIHSRIIPLSFVMFRFNFGNDKSEIAGFSCKYQWFRSGSDSFCQMISSGRHAAAQVIDLVTQSFQHTNNLFCTHGHWAVVIFKRNRASVCLTMAQGIPVKTNNERTILNKWHDVIQEFLTHEATQSNLRKKTHKIVGSKAAVKGNPLSTNVIQAGFNIQIRRPAARDKSIACMAMDKTVSDVHSILLDSDAAPVTPCRHDSPTTSGKCRGDTGGRSADKKRSRSGRLSSEI